MAFAGFARDFRTKRCLLSFLLVYSLSSGFLTKNLVSAQMNGFRVESFVEEAAADAAGRVSVVGNRDVTIRVFTVEPLTAKAQVSFTKVLAEKDSNCEDLRSTAIFNLMLDNSGDNATGQSSSARAIINLPGDSAVYMFCIRRWPNSSSIWLHQGKANWLQLAVTGPASSSRNLLPVWASIIIVAVLIAVSALCTALGVETLSLSRTELKTLRSCGISDERRFSKAMSPLRKRGNRVLCGLLFSGFLANACIAVLIEDMLQLPGAAMVISAGLILLFSVLLPLVVSSRVGLLVAAKSSWIVNIFVVISFPFSYPFGRLLDWFLADDLPTVCDRNRLQCLQQSSQTSTVVKEEDKDENKASGSKSLGLSTKCVKDLMTSIDEVFMVEYNGVLDEKTLEHILNSGYTRIPVYEKDPTNIVALLHVRDLAYVHANDHTSLRTLCKFYNHPVNFVFEDTNLEVMLEEFKKGQSHMAFVQRVNCEGTGDPFYETLGMITLEDVIESIFQSEVIADPPDIIRDNALTPINLKKTNGNDFTRLPKRSRKELSPQIEAAVNQFLSSLPPFSDQIMSQKILSRLLRQDVIVNIDLDSNADYSSRRLYERGSPSDCFTLVVEGRVKIYIGSEDFIFEGGPFMYFGLQALTGAIHTASTGEASTHGDASRSRVIEPYIPDYTVAADSSVQLVRINVTEYLAAVRAAALEHRIHDENVSSSDVDEYTPVNGDILSLEMEYPIDDQDSSITTRSRSQLLDHGHADV